MTKSEKTMVGFVSVFISSALWPNLPDVSLIALVLGLLFFTISRRWSYIINGMLIGFLWASACAYFFVYGQLDNKYFAHNLIVEGKVVSLMPIQNQAIDRKLNKRKFTFSISKIGERSLLFSPKVRLSWFRPEQAIQQGDTLRLLVKLKPPVGLANPHGFNYQTWLTSKNIVAIGYVITSPSNRTIRAKRSIRQALVNQLQQHQYSQIRWILALSYGDRHLLKQDDWALLQQTGTAHLFAISGMHLGIVFSYLLMLNKGLLHIYIALRASRKPVKQILLMPIIFLISCICCMFYAYLAGNDVPVMRALLTAFLWTVLFASQRHWRPTAVFLTLLCSFFILFPYAILGISFWFSFTAIFLILLFIWRFPLPTQSPWYLKLVYVIKLQLFMSIATLPMLAIAFSALPISSFVANLVITPILTFVLVPTCLIASLLTFVNLPTHALYGMINEIFLFTFYVLTHINEAVNKSFQGVFETYKVAKFFIYYLQQPGAVLVLLLVFLPKWQGKYPLVLSLLWLTIGHTLFTNKYLQKGQQWQMYVMDVGQGSAIIIRQQQHYLLYDTGNAFNGFSMASTVLKPFFDARNLEHLDYFVLSHLDNDHAGGAVFISENLQVKQFLSPANGCSVDAASTGPRAKSMSTVSSHYLMGELNIQILWPLKPVSGEQNNDSCVIRISDSTHSILLTGDIEKPAEMQLLQYYKQNDGLKSDVLIAPHHGSKTSSTQQFIEAVAPRYVVFTSGYRNRWDFPDKQVVQRYQKIGATPLITGRLGRVRFIFEDKSVKVSSYRENEYKRWYFKAR